MICCDVSKPLNTRNVEISWCGGGEGQERLAGGGEHVESRTSMENGYNLFIYFY